MMDYAARVAQAEGEGARRHALGVAFARLDRGGVAQVANVAASEHVELLPGQFALDLLARRNIVTGGAPAAHGDQVQALLGAKRFADGADRGVACDGLEGTSEVGDIGWRARKLILRWLPAAAVTTLSRWNYRRLNRAHRRQLAKG